MRKIKVDKWKAKMPNGDEGEENTLMLLSFLISNKKPEELPRGLDNFRLFNRISHAFEKADKSGFLELEESDYLFLRKTVENDIPSSWGMNLDVSNTIEAFLSAKME